MVCPTPLPTTCPLPCFPRGVQAEVARRAFEQKGFVTVLARDAEGQHVGLERAIELAMDVGAEDVQEEEDDERQDKQIAKLQVRTAFCTVKCIAIW